MRILLGKSPELYGKLSNNSGGFVVCTYFRKAQLSSLPFMIELVGKFSHFCSDWFKLKTSTFSIRSLIWGHHKTGTHLSQPSV